VKAYSVAAIAVALGLLGVYAAHKLSGPTVAAVAPPSDSDIKEKAKHLDYESIARDPGKYAGVPVVFQGKVIQTLESDTNVVLRVNVTSVQYDAWKDTVWVNYRKKSSKETRILQNDIVRFWGRFDGIQSYRAAAGYTVQIPRVTAGIVEFAGATEAKRGSALIN
jgi:hypothetical protein